MLELKRVIYRATYKNSTFDILCWEGTPLSMVWNSQKCWFLPGSVVTIKDNHGNAQEFMRGLC